MNLFSDIQQIMASGIDVQEYYLEKSCEFSLLEIFSFNFAFTALIRGGDELRNLAISWDE